MRGLKCVRAIHRFVQLACLALLPTGNTAEDLKELDKKSSSPQLSLKSKKPVKLFTFPPLRARHYFKFEGVPCLFVLLLPNCIIDLMRMKLFDSASRLDVTFTSSETEEPVHSLRLHFRWLYGTWTLILEKCNDEGSKGGN